MAAYTPSEDIPLPSPYGHPSFDEADPSPEEAYGDVLEHRSQWHQAETSPPTRGHWHNADDFHGGGIYLDSSRNIATVNDYGSPYEAAYAAGGFRSAGPTFPPNYMAGVPTAVYPSSASFPVPANGTYYDTSSYATPGISFPSPRTSPRIQEHPNTQPTHHDHGVRCQWGTPACGQTLSDGSSATIRAHLREAHGIGHGTGTPDARRTTARCLWGGECSVNSDHILVSGMGKHVATSHLKTTRLHCPSCGQPCSRRDALQRHAELYCRGARQTGDHSHRRGEPAGRRS